MSLVSNAAKSKSPAFSIPPIFNPKVLRKLLSDVDRATLLKFMWVYFLHDARVFSQNRLGIVRPTSALIEPTTYCTANCKGCYVSHKERADPFVMSLDVAKQIIEVCKKYGIRIYNFIGGEPLSEATIPLIHDICVGNPSSCFYCCTNSRIFDTQSTVLDNLLKLNNMSIQLSIDGFEKTNDLIRGKGSFELILSAAKKLLANRCLFGAVVTIRKSNLTEVISPKFINFLVQAGFLSLSYSVSSQIPPEQNASVFNQIRCNAAGTGMPYVYVGSTGYISFNIGKTRKLCFLKTGEMLFNRRNRTEKVPLANIGSYIQDMRWLTQFTGLQ